MGKITPEIIREIEQIVTPAGVRENEPLWAHTSFKIGGPTTMVTPADSNAAKALYRFCYREGLPCFTAGNGTNLLCADEGFDGIYVQTLGMAGVSVTGESVYAEAGALLSKTATAAWKAGLKGMASLHGIPGTIGGAVTMNAGAYGAEMSGIVRETLCLRPDGTEFTLRGEEHRFGYRHSRISEQPGTVVLASRLELEPGDPAEIEAEMKDRMQKRKNAQPVELPSAGSVFKRPEGHFVGAMVQECGLKGYAIGGAQVSEKHAGFIVNRGGATARDVRRLIEYIRETVFKAYGVTLVCEIRPLGMGTEAL